MSIVSSQVIEDYAQADGRRWIRALFTDHVGTRHFRVWMAAISEVVNLSQFIAALEAALVETEIQENLGRIYADGHLAVVKVVYATTNQNGAAVREAYKTAKREQVWALAAFLNTLTNAQLGALFGVSGAALTSLRTRLQAGSAKWLDYIATVGE